MATHNQARVVGYLLKDPMIQSTDEESKILFKIRTVRRSVEGYVGPNFEDIFVYYDGTEFMEKIKKLRKLDLVDITGVFNILTVHKRSHCLHCDQINIKYMGSSTFIYPIAFTKLNGLQTTYEDDENLPDMILVKQYKEVSNRILILGTVTSEPEMVGTEKYPCCRYRLGVDRKYYNKTQDFLTADYPWVYSYGQQARNDHEKLYMGSLVLIDGFMHNLDITPKMECSSCGSFYTYPDTATSFIPYSVEYLANFLTGEKLAELALQKELDEKMMIHDAL